MRWLNAVLVLLEMEMFVFFIALRSIAGWYIFSFYYCLVLNQYHSFVSFNHNYSDTWLSSRIDTMCFYHLRVVFCHYSQNLEIYHLQCHILKRRVDFDFFFFLVFRLRIRSWVWNLSEMPFSYFKFVKCQSITSVQAWGPNLEMGNLNYMQCMDCVNWQENTSTIL